MENALLTSAIDSNETGNRADRTGNFPISKFQTQHAYMPNQTTGKSTRSSFGGSLNEEEFLEEGEQPSSKRRGVKRGAARRPSCRGHKEILNYKKLSLGGEAPHQRPPTY